MELRVLKYFLVVAQEENFTRAAEKLHLSQPTLSRQLRDLEEEYGKQLLIRGARRVTLTQDGLLLRKRAEEILSLVAKTESELLSTEDAISGEIRIGAGESINFQLIMQAAAELRQKHPAIRFHIITGDGSSNLYLLDRGLIDFAYDYGRHDPSRYQELALPVRDHWGVLLRKDDALAQNQVIRASDLWLKPLIISRQVLNDTTHGEALLQWLAKHQEELTIAGSYNLIFNASLMVEAGLGYALAFTNIINTQGSDLCFRPLEPPVYTQPNIFWKRSQFFSPASKLFLDLLLEKFSC